jgi:hypothetical protein
MEFIVGEHIGASDGAGRLWHQRRRNRRDRAGEPAIGIGVGNADRLRDIGKPQHRLDYVLLRGRAPASSAARRENTFIFAWPMTSPRFLRSPRI